MPNSQRVTLRPFRAADLPIMREWFRDPATARTWARAAVVPDNAFEADLAEKFSRFTTSGYFAVDNAQGELIGRADFEGLDPIDRSAEIMLMIGKSGDRGKGYGREALNLLVRYLFVDRGAERVWLTVLASNATAIRLYESYGFVREGHWRQQRWVGGSWEDQIIYGLLRDEFAAHSID